MWKRRNRQRSQTAASAVAAPSLAIVPPPALPLPVDVPSVEVSPAVLPPSSHIQLPPRAPSLAEPNVSPLQMTFDFELAKPPSKNQLSEQVLRPKTSDGVAAGSDVNKSSLLNPAPPTLPPIPRIASKDEFLGGTGSQNNSDAESLRAKNDSDNVSRLSQATRKPWLNFFNRSNESLPALRPQTSAGGLSAKQDARLSSRPSTSGGPSVATVESPMPSKDSSLPSQLIDTSSKMEATRLPNAGPIGHPHGRQASSLSTNKSFMENRDNLKSNKQAARRPANIQTGSEALNATPPPNIFASPIALPSPNMLSAPSPMSVNFNSTLREKRATMMSTASGVSLRAPSISGMRLSPASSRNSIVPKSPTYSVSHLSPTNSTFGPNSLNAGRKSISGARLSPQSSFDTFQKDPSPERNSTMRKSWLAPEWTFEGDENTPKPPPIPESFRERPESSGSLVGATFNNKTPISAEPAPFELQRTQTNASSRSVKLPPHPSVFYEPKPAPDQRPRRKVSRPHLLTTKSSPDLREAASVTPGPSDITGTTAGPSPKIPPLPTASISKRSRKSTIGTPYSETSDAFPMPQLVAVRPQTEGNLSAVGGTLVPTHFTSSTLQPEKSKAKQAKAHKEKEKMEMAKQVKAKLEKEKREQASIKDQEEQLKQERLKAESGRPTKEKPEVSKQEKVERRKTRLLNPMTLLSRKRTGLPTEITLKPSTEEKSEQARAFARQKSVAAIGVEKLPSNYDPRIKGKVVHDFSTPSRSSTRNFSYNEQDWEAEKNLGNRGQSASIPAVQYNPTAHEDSARRSVHSPHFREMLDDDTGGEHQVNALQAEKLENKDFLQRASRQSTVTILSQESAILPPFARRSQQSQLEASQSGSTHETDSKRSSNPSTVNHSVDRNSALSALSVVSPITQLSSNMLPDLRHSGSPISPTSPSNKSPHPFSSEVAQTRPISSASHMHIQPSNFDPILEHPPTDILHTLDTFDTAQVPKLSLPDFGMAYSASSRPALVNRDSAQAPEAVVFPSREDSKSPVPPSEAPMGAADAQQSIPETPEDYETSGSVQGPQNPPQLAENIAPATSHSQRGSLLPKHQSSNASRFSFQFGGSAQEEEALEEKHRKSARLSKSVNPDIGPPEGDDDDDFFDEDAMNDMDEMEIQEQKRDDALMPAALTLLQARQHLQAPASSSESDNDERRGSDATDAEDITYADHPAYRAYAAMNSNETGSQGHSRQTSGGSSSNHAAWRDNDILRYIDGYSSHHLRDLSEASVLTVNTNVVQSPSRETHSSQPSLSEETNEATFVKRDPSHSQRVGSSLSAAPTEIPDKHESLLSSSTVASAGTGTSTLNKPRLSSQTSMAQSSRPETATDIHSVGRSSGLALSALEDLNFGDGPDLSIAGSRSLSPEQPRIVNRRTKDSETIPDWRSAMSHPYSSGDNSSGRNTQSPGFSAPDRDSHQSAMHTGAISKNIRVREDSNDRMLASTPGGEDDMYFDDGGFEQDIKTKPSPRTALDEESLDSDIFQRGSHGSGPEHGHQRDNSGVTVTSVGGDGPYPTFAMGANPAKVLQRQSQLLLQDLPLEEGLHDPKLIPQRNPSEDVRRSDLGDRGLPFPLEQGDREGTVQVPNNLQAYHAALANAANRAAADGRFSRMPSGASSLAQSVSVASTVGDGGSSQVSKEDRSYYSRDEAGNMQVDPVPHHGLGLSSGSYGGSEQGASFTESAHLENPLSYSPPKMSFDFGFKGGLDADQALDDTPGMHDDFETDDDVIAAANAEALANDDEGFYGHEFGFYAKARSNSNDLEAINGGFFGEDGDNGLTRNKSVLEPNLTPITERSEFSTRNSFIGLNHGSLFGPPSSGPLSAGLFGPGSPAMSRFPVTPLLENEVTTFDQLRRLRADAFGGSNASSGSENKGTPSNLYNSSPTQNARPSAAAPSYFNSPSVPHLNVDSTETEINSISTSSAINHGYEPSNSSSQQADPEAPLPDTDTDTTPRRPRPTPLTFAVRAKHGDI
nr:hypothetical protein CFP56_00366 [Quercus suber]